MFSQSPAGRSPFRLPTPFRAARGAGDRGESPPGTGAAADGGEPQQRAEAASATNAGAAAADLEPEGASPPGEVRVDLGGPGKRPRLSSADGAEDRAEDGAPPADDGCWPGLRGFRENREEVLWGGLIFLAVTAGCPVLVTLVTGDDRTPATVLLVVGSCFIAGAVPISFYSIHRHLAHYEVPELQIHVLRILWLVPIYSLNAFLSLLFVEYCHPGLSIYFDALREAYEAYVVYAFYQYLVTHIQIFHGEDLGTLLQVRGGDDEERRVPHLAPLHFKIRTKSVHVIKGWRQGHPFVKKCKWGILLYVVLSLLCTLLTFIFSAARLIKSDEPAWGNPYSYLSAINATVSFWAIYCLVLLYKVARVELAPLQPLGKFICVKGIVFATWWQGYILQWWGNSRYGPQSMFDWQHCPTISKTDVLKAVNNFLVCVEVLFFAVGMHYNFPSADFGGARSMGRNDSLYLRRGGGAAAGAEATAPLLGAANGADAAADHGAAGAGAGGEASGRQSARSSHGRNVKAMFNVDDVGEDIRDFGADFVRKKVPRAIRKVSRAAEDARSRTEHFGKGVMRNLGLGGRRLRSGMKRNFSSFVDGADEADGAGGAGPPPDVLPGPSSSAPPGAGG